MNKLRAVGTNLTGTSAQFNVPPKGTILMGTQSHDANAAFEKLIGLFKLPPLRRSEDLEPFKAVFADFFNDLGPSGFVTDVIVYRISIETWHMFELMKDRVLLVARKEREKANSGG